MSVIIRLQNLPWSANALDIRQFFHGLSIPEGGVHIVGGEQGDAFIAFSTDEDARQAFNRNNGKIKEIQIKLLLSSRTEMQKVIETARAQSFAAFMPQPAPSSAPILPSAVPELKKPPSSRSSSDRDTAKSDGSARRRRSRSKSRDRRRRRSRSRDRRRRRERSRSRDRKAHKRRDSDEKKPLAPKPKPFESVWANTPPNNFNTGTTSLNNLGNNSVWSTEPPPSLFNPSLPPSEEDLCIKLQPFYGGYGDIRRFFYGCVISNIGIKFINDENGYRTGLVYIQFRHAQSKRNALLRSGQLLNGATVQITHLDDLEFEQAIDRFQPDNFVSNNDHANDQRSHKYRNKNYYDDSNDLEYEFSCLIVDDLPTYCKEQDILKMFSPRPLLALFLVPKQLGRVGQVAYVQFGSCEEARKAFDDKSAHFVEGKAVTVKVCTDHEFDTISKQHIIDLDPPTPEPVILDTDCINVTGLPSHTNQIEITDFFSDVGIRPVKIHLMSNRLGFTGQAFCEFKSNEEATQAVKKDGVSFGLNVVAAQAIQRVEMERIVGLSNRPPPLLGPRSLMAAPNAPQRPIFLRNTYDGVPRTKNVSRFGNNGGFVGGGGQPRNWFVGNGGGGGNVDEVAPPGCAVFLDNIPYKAGNGDILDFFDGYDISANVSRRFNPNNTPSPEAKVIFSSPDEAYRAVQEKNGAKIWERTIYLKQV